MPSYSIIENFEVHKNNRFLEIAEALKPELLHKERCEFCIRQEESI